MPAVPADVATVHPGARVEGTVSVPGDKSISHRYALLAALADGTSVITGFSPGADCAATLACLKDLGVTIDTLAPHTVLVNGRGLRGLERPARPLDAANSGTTFRLLAGVLAAHAFDTGITGDGSLRRRPMRRVIEPLERMGARIEAAPGDRPPLLIHGADLTGITHAPAVPSAQVKSAVLLAGIHAAGDTVVREPARTRDHTERALQVFGLDVHCSGNDVRVSGGKRLQARDVAVPGDISSAAFWAVLAAGTPAGCVEIPGVGLNPSRTAILDVLRRAGAHIQVSGGAIEHGEPVGTLRVAYGRHASFEVTPAEVPEVIDEIPALAALAAMMPPGRQFTVRGASELRVKESDRISALARGFQALGVTVLEYEDGFTIESGGIVGGTADAAGDHRLAMAFAIAATGGRNATIISGASSVDVSYPGFFDELARLRTR